MYFEKWYLISYCPHLDDDPRVVGLSEGSVYPQRVRSRDRFGPDAKTAPYRFRVKARGVGEARKIAWERILQILKRKKKKQ